MTVSNISSALRVLFVFVVASVTVLSATVVYTWKAAETTVLPVGTVFVFHGSRAFGIRVPENQITSITGRWSSSGETTVIVASTPNISSIQLSDYSFHGSIDFILTASGLQNEYLVFCSPVNSSVRITQSVTLAYT